MKKTHNKITFKDSENEYAFALLNLKQIRTLLIKTASVLAPILGEGASLLDSVRKHEHLVNEYLEEGLSPPDQDIDLLTISTLVSQQIVNPLFEEVIDGLLEGALINGEPYLIENFGAEEFNRYRKVVEMSFKDNLLLPLVGCLHEKGYSEIVGLVQAIIQSKVGSSNTDSSTS